MFKTILRFLIVTLIAVALGAMIYHLNQPARSASFGSGIRNIGNFSRDFGGEGGFHEGGFSLSRGLFGIKGNLLLVAIVTVIVVSMQKTFARKPEPARTR